MRPAGDEGGAEDQPPVLPGTGGRRALGAGIGADGAGGEVRAARPLRTRIKHVAELSHVREVSLFGTAELAYWEWRLKPEGLTPAERKGRAEILVSGAEGRFMG